MRIRPPIEPDVNSPVLLLIHGWTGDENSMGIFANRLSRRWWVIAPRGPIKAPDNGFGWITPDQAHFQRNIEDFLPSAQALLLRLDGWGKQSRVNTSRIAVAGFSQGAALGYSIALAYPERVSAMAALAGFAPDIRAYPIGAALLREIPFFIAHGAQDDTIAVEQARQAVRFLSNIGAQVSYCEDETGHKLSLSCLRSFEAFFKDF